MNKSKIFKGAITQLSNLFVIVFCTIRYGLGSPLLTFYEINEKYRWSDLLKSLLFTNSLSSSSSSGKIQHHD